MPKIKGIIDVNIIVFESSTIEIFSYFSENNDLLNKYNRMATKDI